MATVTLNPSEDIAGIVSADPAGTTFVFEPGVYYVQGIAPLDNDQFIGEPGAVLDGATILPNWTYSNGYWVASGLPAAAPTSGVAGTNDMATHPNDLFVNDTLYTRVDSLSELGPGKWYFDETSHQAYLDNDPTNATVELGTAPAAFDSAASGVAIEGLTIEKYASPAGLGAVMINGSGWQLINDTIQQNHGAAVAVFGPDAIIEGGHLVNNGQEGIDAYEANGLVVKNVEIAYNNYAGFDIHWEAGGFKISDTTGAQITDNYIHDNIGVGVWLDTNNSQISTIGNVITDNYSDGIAHEISYAATDVDNVLVNNAQYSDGGVVPAQIYIADGSDVDVGYNFIETGPSGVGGVGLSYEPRGSGTQGAYTTSGNVIHDNTIDLTGSSGLDGFIAYSATSTAQGFTNTWQNNDYVAASANQTVQDYLGETYTLAQAQAAGLDQGSTLAVHQDAVMPVVDAGDAASATISGGDASSILVAGAGTDTLVAGQGDDFMLAGTGQDTFVIPDSSGSPTIIGLNAANGDVVELEGSTFTSFSQIVAALTADGPNTALALGNGHSLTFDEVAPSQLTASEFLLGGTSSAAPPPAAPPPAALPPAASPPAAPPVHQGHGTATHDAHVGTGGYDIYSVTNADDPAVTTLDHILPQSHLHGDVFFH